MTTPPLWTGALLVALTCGCASRAPAPEITPPQPEAGLAVAEPTAIDPPSQPGAYAPGVFATSDGDVLLVWVETLTVPDAREESPTRRVQWAELTATGWSAPETIISGDDVVASSADTPMIARDGKGRTFVSFARKAGASPYAYDVMLARKDGPGQEWKMLGSPHDDKTETEHGFVSMVPRADGVQIVWLDGRLYASPSKGPTTLRTAFVGDTIKDTAEIDDRVCDCCNTAAALIEQRMLVLYRDRDADELRDVALVQETAQGWSPPSALHIDGWNIAGCPVNGPAVYSDGARAWTAWYTGANEKSTLKAAVAAPGASFGAPIILADGSGQTAPLGRLAVAPLGDDEIAVTWLAGLPEGAAWSARRLSAQGELGATVVLVPATRAHASGFARLVRARKGLVFIYTDAARPDSTRLRALRLDPELLPRR